MGATYSERFLSFSNGEQAYTVPAGKRAVIKCLTAYNGSAAASYAVLYVASLPVLFMPIPAGSGADRSGLHIVVYQNEQLSMYVATANVACCSGYLLDDIG